MIILLNIIILGAFVIIWLLSKNYEKEFIDTLEEKKYKLKVLYSLGLYLVDKFNLQQLNNRFSKQEESLKALYVGEQINTVKRLYLCNKIALLILIIFTFNILSFISNISAHQNREILDGNYIVRPSKEEGSKTISLDVHIKKEDLTVLVDEIQLEVHEQQYDKEELKELMDYGKNYIESNFLKDNRSVNEIQSDLNFISQIPGTKLLIEWRTQDYQLVTRDGLVKNEELKEKISTWVTAIISYYDVKVEHTIQLQIMPKDYTIEELAKKNLTDKLNDINKDTITDDKLQLPSTIDDANIYWAEKEDTSGLTFLVMGILTAIVIFILADKDLNDKVEKRNRQMLLDYPEIINKFTLLLGAGMPLANAWQKIVQDYKAKTKDKRYAYEEMLITSNELMLGISEISAYERFGRRVKLLSYLRLASLLAQNVKKGSSDLLRLLELEAVEAFEERKELAKRIGEEAGTKLLMPMMLMLLIVLVIIIVPAFLSFQI